MPGRAPFLLVAIALVLATVTAYAPVFENEFVAFDDDLYITANYHVRQGLSAEGAFWAFSSFHGANWFPLTRLSWMLDAELFGLEPRAFHATSLALHIANTLLLLLACARLTGALAPSAFVAAVFALHPLHVESVAWASERKDVLSGLFAMLVLLLYERFVRRGATPGRHLTLLACLILGLMAKPVLVTWPFVLLLLDEWPLARLRGEDPPGAWEARRIRRALAEKLPLFAAAAGFSVLTAIAQRSWDTTQSLGTLGLGPRLANAAVAYVDYLAQTFWPRDLAFFYPHPGDGLPPARVVASTLVLFAVSAGCLALWRRRPYLVVGWLWFLGTLVPMIGLVQVGVQARADRYTYLSQIGLCIAVAWGARDLLARSRAGRAAAAALGVAVAVALGTVTFAQVRIWRDDFTLFEHALRVTRDNHVAHINLGQALMGRGQYDEAVVHLRDALRIVPGSPMAHAVMGDLRLHEGRLDDAVRHYRRSLRRPLNAARAHAGLAAAHLRLGDLEASVAHARRSLAHEPRDARVHANLGIALLRMGRPGPALESLERATRLDPGMATAHAHLGVARMQRGDSEGALAAVTRARELEPDTAEYRVALARVLDAQGREAEAIEQYRAAVALGSRAPDVLNDLAWLLATSASAPPGSSGEAIALAREAIAADGGRRAASLDTLAAAYAAAGRFDEARSAGREALALAEAGERRRLTEAIRAHLDEYEAGRALR